MRVIRATITAILFLGIVVSLNAQQKAQAKYDTWSLKLHAGTMQFYGDISYNTFFPGSRKGNELSLTGHVSLCKQLTRYFGVNGQFLVGSLNSEEEGENRYFNASIINYNLNGQVSASTLLNPSKFDRKLDFYVTFGLGYTHYRTVLRDLRDDSYVNSFGYSQVGNSDETKKEKRVMESVANLGAGVKWKLSDKIDLELEVAIKSTPKDKLDGYTNIYTELDKYGYSTIGIAYNIGRNKNSLLWNQKDATEELVEKMDSTDNKLDSLMQVINNMNSNLTIVMNEREAERGPDNDNDSVPDYRDVELNTPPGVFVDVQGREIKGDMLNIAQGSSSSSGGGVGQSIFSVFFGLNSTYVTPLNHERIAIAANLLKKNKDIKFEIVGSTCTLASNQYNIDLSKRRVETVKNIFIKEYGIEASRLIVKYVGEEKPLNITQHNKYINRRVDIFVK